MHSGEMWVLSEFHWNQWSYSRFPLEKTGWEHGLRYNFFKTIKFLFLGRKVFATEKKILLKGNSFISFTKPRKKKVSNSKASYKFFKTVKKPRKWIFLPLICMKASASIDIHSGIRIPPPVPIFWKSGRNYRTTCLWGNTCLLPSLI